MSISTSLLIKKRPRESVPDPLKTSSVQILITPDPSIDLLTPRLIFSGSIEATKGSIEGSRRSIEGSKGSIEGSKRSIEGSKGSIEGSRDQSRGRKNQSRGRGDQSRGRGDQSRGRKDQSRGPRDQSRGQKINRGVETHQSSVKTVNRPTQNGQLITPLYRS